MRRRLLRLCSLMFSLLILFSALSLPALCAETTHSLGTAKVVYYPDGSREEIVLGYESGGYRSTVTGHITKTFYSSNDEPVWRVRLNGSFTYNGVVSNCTNAYITTTFYQSGWSVISENTTHNANVAATHVELGKRILGIVHTAGYADLSITCDKDGNLS